MDDLSAGGWLLLLVVLMLVVWGGFIAWSGGLGKAFLQAWGLRGARLFKKPSAVVEKPHAQRSHGAGHGAHGAHGALFGASHPRAPRGAGASEGTPG